MISDKEACIYWEQRAKKLTKENVELKEAILKWWEEHEYDTQGDFGEYNVYDEEPYFVRLAKK